MENVIANLSAAADRLYGRDHVSVELGNAPSNADARISLRPSPDNGLPGCEMLFHEVWWRDLGVRPTFLQLISFWAWAISVPGTQGHYDHSDRTIPLANREAEQRALSFSTRMEILFKVTYFFVMLAPLNIVAQFIMIIPGLPRFSFFRKIFAYASSIQLYTAARMRGSSPASDHLRPARVSIQRRLLDRIYNVAWAYDHWYIVSHSLGSVIAAQALFHDDIAYARFAPQGLIFDKNRDALGVRDLGVTGSTKPRYEMDAYRPAWLATEHAVDSRMIFQRFRGLVTYGSPIELFARAWPGTLCVQPDRKFRANTEWINLVDPNDIVATTITSFDERHGLVPDNITIAAGEHIANSHSKYFAQGLLKQPSKAAETLLRWFTTDSTFRESMLASALSTLSLQEQTRRRALGGLQWLLVFIVGIVIWPAAAQTLYEIFSRLFQAIGHLHVVEIVIKVFERDWDYIRDYLREDGMAASIGLGAIIVAIFVGSLIRHPIEKAQRRRREKRLSGRPLTAPTIAALPFTDGSSAPPPR